MAKTIQIAAVPASSGFHGDLLYALLDDGTIWTWSTSWPPWRKVPSPEGEMEEYEGKHRD